MSNPLAPIIETFDIASDAFEVVLAAADHTSPSSPDLHSTVFESESREGCDYILTIVKEELDDLIVVNLAAAFERTLKDYITNAFNVSAGASISLQQSQSLSAWLEKRTDDAYMNEIMRLFLPKVSENQIQDAMKICKYRNWIAHGRKASKKPSALIDSASAYNTLTQFLINAGLVY